jgi:hypothetical protein
MTEKLIISDSNLPPFDLVLRAYINHYLKKISLHMLPRSRWRYLVFVIELLHLILATCAFTFGIFLPPKWLPYNIILVSVVIVGWKLLGYCLITKIVSQITGERKPKEDQNDAQFIVPFSETFLVLYGMLIIALSIFFYLIPSHAPFNIIKSILVALYARIKD